MHTWQGAKENIGQTLVFLVSLPFFYVKESHYEIDRRRNFWK